MEKASERPPDTSPGRSPLLRDKRNRPFKALTPRRWGQDVLLENKCSIIYSQVPSTSFLGKSPQRIIPSIKRSSVGTSKENLHTLDNGPNNAEDEEANQESPQEPKRRNTRSQLCAFIHKNEFGSDFVYRGPYGSNVVTYLDYTASGRPLKCIEAFIQRYVLPTYSNTHTEVSYNAMQTCTFREEARDIIRKSVNAGDEDCVIFTGSGVTAAVNKIVYCLRLEEMGSVIVFIGPYEHHSNILPWVHSAAQVIRIPQDRDGMFDIKTLAFKLEEVQKNAKKAGKPSPFIIGAFSAASNVTGIITPTYPISCLIHKYNGVVLWDYACAGPYVNIDMNPAKNDPDSDDEPYKDAVYISPHKFMGGPGTPGILIAKKWMFQNQVPHDVGGGTVLFVRRSKHVYMSNPEHREEGGTPAIIESIRCGLVFKLKDAVGAKYIMRKEQNILKKAVSFLQEVDGLVMLGNTNVHRLPILSFLVYNTSSGRFLHHDYVATIFNDVFGMQVRSGCACAGPYGMDLMGMSEQHAEKFEKLLTVSRKDTTRKPSSKFLERESVVFQNAIFKPGFVRLNLPYFMTESCMDFVLKAIRLVALHGWSLLPQYRCDVDKGGWAHIGTQPIKRHLDEVSFASGSMTVKKPVSVRVGCKDCNSGGSSGSSSSVSLDNKDSSHVNYTSILKRAEGLFYDAMSGLYDMTDDNTEGISDELMWFMTPKEAADIIHKRKTRCKVKPENLPFMPGGLAVKLGIDPTGHVARGKEMDKDFPVEYYPQERHQSPLRESVHRESTSKQCSTTERASKSGSSGGFLPDIDPKGRVARGNEMDKDSPFQYCPREYHRSPLRESAYKEGTSKQIFSPERASKHGSSSGSWQSSGECSRQRNGKPPIGAERQKVRRSGGENGLRE